MTYVKKTWVNGSRGGTPITAEDLNRMEDGIAGVYRTQAITSGTFDLGTMNEWTVANPVTVALPPASPPFVCTVHVKTGFQKITWPNGTLIVGETTENDVWITLRRLPTGWVVLIPSGGGSGLVDTGWSQPLNAANLGSGLQFIAGDASMVGPAWTLGVGSFGGVSIRRSGNNMLVYISGGWVKESGTGALMFSIPKPAGFVPDPNSVECINAVTVGGARVPQAYLYSGSDATRLTFSLTPSVPAGVSVKTTGPLIFPLHPTTTWGD